MAVVKVVIFPLVLMGIALAASWPLFFRRWKHHRYLWILSSIFVVALGAWSMLYFRFERNYALRAEAEAVKATRDALVSGVDPRRLADTLDALDRSEAFEAGGVRARYRLWYEAVKGMER